MQLADHFNVLLRDTVNLGRFKLDLLDDRVGAIYRALKADDKIGSLVLDKIPQGSWAHQTIISPVGDNEFDADFLLLMKEKSEWANDPKTYINEVYAALHRHSIYKDMPHMRKCRCVRLVYKNSMHVDIVPYVQLGDGRDVIVNRDANIWENTNPEGFTSWMHTQDNVADGNLRKVIRLFKYLRDHKNSFTGTRSIILTTLLGNRVDPIKKLTDPGYYGNVPTALLHIISDLDAYLQANVAKPSVPDPSGSGVTFDHRWDQTTYSYFRDRVHAHAADIKAAYVEPNKETSVRLWRALFGDGFKAPESQSNGSKFPTGIGAATTTVGRSGRAG
ncbi:nucleotidyltransferase [Microtetraspora sp. AC03309]|uniref:SMODS domain-containing nucleotidyltransferase n=1 Tax=Microtetraspora sp. AC03309 TaxID=2779376 RepID=UPI001E50CF18|nr:nucleotidyltransferase [Microtetraspora sp. AC03309]MCC5581786.1 nucleotidyltransferase [Microtetraspora sp. AC03309]